VYKYFLNPHALTPKEHLHWFKTIYIYDENRIDWMAIKREGDIPVGVFGIKREDKNSDSAEVSYLLAPEQQGRGYAAEAVGRLCDFCRDEWHCKKVTAEIHRENLASVCFIKKLGFKEGEGRGSFVRYEKT
jgi:RimJ/RimL family protein N-acetyltransferase